MTGIFLAVAAAAALQTAPASTASPPADLKAQIAKADKDILAFYPPAALAHGIEGSATITCRSKVHGALRGCVLVSESPKDDGFGQAALAMAEASVGREDLNLSPKSADAERWITIRFRTSPPSVTPNLLIPFTVIINPDWVSLPSGRDLADVYPWNALRRGLNGQVRIRCTVSGQGALVDCAVVSEMPADKGFGQAALKVAKRFRMRAFTKGGFPTEGAKITIPFEFEPPLIQ